MASATTSGIKVSVDTFYQHDYSNPLKHKYVFAYRVHIENQSERAVQLISRRWVITNGYGTIKLVEGMGVIGRQPVIQPGQAHEYYSGCELTTDMGTMAGVYIMRPQDGDKEFEVIIPKFEMVTPSKAN